MDLQFLRGDPQAPKGHAIFVARSRSDSQVVFSTYCLVPPIPLSLTKYLPSFLAAQLPQEELREGANMNVMPIPPMLEEGSGLTRLQMLAEYRDDDLCDLGDIDAKDESVRMQRVVEACQEYGQLYYNYSLTFEPEGTEVFAEEAPPLDELDAEDLLLQTMTDRERLTEVGKLIGMARYALEGNDEHLLQERGEECNVSRAAYLKSIAVRRSPTRLWTGVNEVPDWRNCILNAASSCWTKNMPTSLESNGQYANCKAHDL